MKTNSGLSRLTLLDDIFLMVLLSAVLGLGNPNVAKAGALQRQGAKGKAVAIYCDPLATQDLECSDFPERVENMRKSLFFLEFTDGEIQKMKRIEIFVYDSR